MPGPYTVTNDPSALSASNDPYFPVANPGDLPIPMRLQAQWTDTTPTAFKAIIGTRQNPGDAAGISYFVMNFGTLTADVDTVAPGALSVLTPAVGGAGNVNSGQHYYLYTLVGGTLGETASCLPQPIAPGVNSIINLTTIGVGPAGSNTTARNVYRTKSGAGIAGPYFLVTTIADNVTTTYNDNATDASLPAARVPGDWAESGTNLGPRAFMCGFTTTTGWARRFRGVTTSAVPRGTFRAFARLRKSVGTDDIRLRLQWSVGPSTVTTATVKNDVVTLDGTEFNTTDMQMVDLGTVSSLSAGSFLYVELFARRASGSGFVAFDSRDAILLVPTETYSVVSVQPAITDEWNGDEAAYSAGSPLLGGGVAILMATNDEVRYYTGSTGAGGGQTLATGVHHLYIFDVEHTTPDSTSTIRVYDNTATTLLASRTKTTQGREKLRLQVASTSGSDLHFGGVALTTAGTGYCIVNRVRHFIVYYLVQNESLMLDPLVHPHIAAQLDSSGNYVRTADHDGNWPLLAPGNNDFVVVLLDSSASPSGVNHIFSRLATFSLTGLPAFAN